MPPFLSVIRTCDKNMREYLFRELSQIISIVKLHARNYMKDIFIIIKVSAKLLSVYVCTEESQYLVGMVPCYYPKISFVVSNVGNIY